VYFIRALSVGRIPAIANESCPPSGNPEKGPLPGATYRASGTWISQMTGSLFPPVQDVSFEVFKFRPSRFLFSEM
jgi:hypothetical protein